MCSQMRGQRPLWIDTTLLVQLQIGTKYNLSVWPILTHMLVARQKTED